MDIHRAKYMLKAVNKSDQEILDGILRQDALLVERVYKAVLPKIVRYVQNNNGKLEDAEDIFQEAMIALFRKVQGGKLILTCTVQTYLISICRHLWLKQLRDSKKDRYVEVEQYEPLMLDDSMMENLEKNSRYRLYQEYFKKLGEKCKTILLLFFEKTPMRQIAVRMDTTEAYIKKRKHACKESLVKMIKEDQRYQEIVHN